MDDLPYLTFFLWKQMTTSMKLDLYEHTKEVYMWDILLYCLLKKLKSTSVMVLGSHLYFLIFF
jgi:hypothetical protein